MAEEARSEHGACTPDIRKPVQGGIANRPITESGAAAAAETEAKEKAAEAQTQEVSTPNPTASTVNAGSSQR